MIASSGPERRRRRPAVSCSLCRRRKIRCNRESPCSNCVKSKSEACVYENLVSPRPQRLGFSRTEDLEDLERIKASHMPHPSTSVSQAPSYAPRSLPSSSKGSSSRTSLASVSEVESLKTKIRRLEEQLSSVTQSQSPPLPANGSSSIETSTSQIAGTFHINHESRLDANCHVVTRSVVMHKSRLFGSSHWAQGASMFRDVFELIEPYMREEGSKAISGIKRCKELARVIKAQRTPQWPTTPTTDLPPKGVTDELVDRYLRTFETKFRILHIPSFKTDYDALWVSETRPSMAFTIQLKLVLALGALTYDEYFSMRPSAVRWVYEAHTWLSDPDFKPQLNIQCLQSRILLLIAREMINVGGDSSWISAGALLRTALFMGLHRDPSHLPNRTALAAEMRRRLWNTILELSLQASILSGGAPLISTSDFDCEAPGNFDDEQLLTEDPVPKGDDEYTQTSTARFLRKTYPQRLAIARTLNDLGSYLAYAETLRLDAGLRDSYRGICRILRGYTSRSGPSPSPFETRALDIIIHSYLCCLHMPFFERSLHEAAYAFSRKVIIESSLKIWCAIYPSSPIMPGRQDAMISDQDEMSRFVTCGFGFYRTSTMIATMFVALELKAQLQDEDSLGPNPYRLDLFSLLSDAKMRAWRMIECGETNVKGFLLASLVTAQIEALMQGMEQSKLPGHLVQAAEQAQERCLSFMEEKAGQGYSENIDEGNGLSVNTTPFMGDWEFIMSDAFFNLGNAEPMSWVLNDESRPFMIPCFIMAPNTEYSQTLQHITDAKLEELSNKRRIFLTRKAAALEKAESLESTLEQVRALSIGVKTCFDIPVKDDGRVVGVSGGNRYIEIATLKYEYATLFAQLTMEWLSIKKNPKSRDEASKSDDYEELASAQKLESRRQWEDYVFTPADCDARRIKTFLDELFTRPLDGSSDKSTNTAKDIVKALEKLRTKVATFETSLADSSQFNVSTLNWVIPGLLNSDLVTDKQRAVLRDFQKDTTILTELADVLNMRLSALHSWSWGAEVAVEQRRQLSGSYQVHMHEDLIQAIFLQYLGVKWSVFFKRAFNEFRMTRNVWKSPRSVVTGIDKKRRSFFLDERSSKNSLQMVKETVYRKAYFVSQLMDHDTHERHREEGEMEADFAVHAKKLKRTKQTARKATVGVARFCREPDSEEESSEDEDMAFGLFDGDDGYDPDQTFESHCAHGVQMPANQMQAKQNLLLLLSADITINKRLHGEVSCFRAQYESLYPSLPHPTILEVLSFLGVSEKWISFFERFLTAPLKFFDEPDAEPRPRRRGTPGAHVLSEVFGETTLFCLDFMINQESNGQLLWRVNDDLWFWSRKEETTIAVWQAIEKFNKIMGLPLSTEKIGGAHITTDSKTKTPLMESSFPSGKIRWGMLYLNPKSGRFEIDQEMVDGHIKELNRQLQDKQSSIFSWIQAYNSYASTFFTYNFGTPANCLGQEHVDQMLQTHQRIQREMFPSDPNGENNQSVITYLRETIQSRFGNTGIPDGYLFLPIDLGGLELKSPFINLLGLRDSVLARPDSLVDKFLNSEQEEYMNLKRRYAAKDKDRLVSRHNGFRPDDIDEFLSFEEYTRHRELLSYEFRGQLVDVYDELLRRPEQDFIECDASELISAGLGHLKEQANLSGIKQDWNLMSSYWKWVAQLYGPEIVERFGGFNIVDPGLLPIGLVSQFRSGRVSWRDE
ncbi:hypothetical protein BDV12DRAFT_187052 [Aspergillus spectabilis]